ncbi:MAG: hypothetical protein ACI9DO_000806 [Reinekea sp.]|uniref:hypothetical protein n=1 Tax=Reinekea sp. TaxID=1970455 RepID=UPI0039892FFC
MKVHWKKLNEQDKWRYLRSVVTREHLHFSGHFQKWHKKKPPPIGPILRVRRLKVVAHFKAEGYELNPKLELFTLPKGKDWKGIPSLLPGTIPNKRL